MNKVILIGRITRNIELKYTESNIAVTQFSVAVNTGYGENQRTDFIECVVWRKLAENISKYCIKGSMVAVEGRLQNSNYEDKDGNKRYSTKLLVENIKFLENKKENSTETTHTTPEESDPFKDFGEEYEISEDDLPF